MTKRSAPERRRHVNSNGYAQAPSQAGTALRRSSIDGRILMEPSNAELSVLVESLR